MKKLLLVVALVGLVPAIAPVGPQLAGPKLAVGQEACTVTTDMPEYAPGDPVAISGTGGPAGMEVSVQVIESASGTQVLEVIVIPDDSGAFSAAWDTTGAAPGSYFVQVVQGGDPLCISGDFTIAAPPAPPPPAPPPPPPAEPPSPPPPPPSTCPCPEEPEQGGTGVVTPPPPPPSGELPFTGAPAVIVGGIGLVLVVGGLVLARRRKG